MTVRKLHDLLAKLTNQNFKIRYRKYLNSAKVSLIVSEDIQVSIEKAK